MSLLMNMRLDGVVGESRSFRHKGWFEVLSWNWGMSSTRKTVHSDGIKTTMNEISVIKPVGVESMSIRLLFARGEIIPTIDFSIEPVTGKREAHKNYVDIKMEGVVIKSIVTGGTNDDSFFKEHITFIFDKVKFECNRPIVDDGSINPDEQGREFGWNVPEDSEWSQ